MSVVGRFVFGGTSSDFTQKVLGTFYGPAGASAFSLWSARTGGTHYTDIIAADQSTAITFVTTNADGSAPDYYPPAGITEAWADAGGPERVLVQARQSVTYGSVVMHGTVATVARPAVSLPVSWYGTLAPTNALASDRWYDTIHELWNTLVGTIWVPESDHKSRFATGEEGFQSVTLGTIATPQAGGLNQTVCGNIPFHMQVTGVSLTVFANVVGSGTNFWTISLRRFRAPNQNQPPIGAGTVASVDPVFTSTVVGNGMWAGVPWDFYGVSGRSETNCELLPGDCLTAFLQTTGSPVALDRLNVTWRYKALS